MDAQSRRETHRFKVAIRAHISDSQSDEQIPCIVRDGSMSGCKIASSKARNFPERISVRIDRLTEPVMGRIVWSGDDVAGVAFFWQSDAYADENSVLL